MWNRTLTTLSLAATLAMTGLSSYGIIAEANSIVPPALPPAPPLSAEAAATLAEPTPVVPPAPQPPATVQQEILFQDNFDQPRLKGWIAEDFSDGPASPAAWLINEGSVIQSGNALGLPAFDGTYLLNGNKDWQDYRIQVDAFAGADTRLGLVARKSNAGHYQARLMAGAESSTLVLERIAADGTSHELARSTAPAMVGHWLELELSVQGNTVMATLDQSVTVSAQDNTLSRGQAGLYATSDITARFDNVVISAR